MSKEVLRSLLVLLVVMLCKALLAPKPLAIVPRVVLKPLPRVYVYDHCPFCVRVRLALGLKNIKHEVRFLANDDIETPTSLVGKKVAPIFEIPGEKAIPESLDIIKKIDSDPQYGRVNMFLPMSGRTDLKDWQSSIAESNRIIIRPRYMMTVLPEFMQTDGKNAFVKNHALPPFEKDDWKKLTIEEQWKIYEDAFVDSSSLIDELNKSLEALDKLIHNPHYCTEGGVSLDDVDLFSRLRSITLVKGVKWPKKLAEYLHYFSRAGDVPLYDNIAV